MHEASLYDENSFLTLTYDNAHLPVRAQLEYSTFQRFFKRLKRAANLKTWHYCGKHKYQLPRMYMCGEYGDENGRPHYHALVFGFGFPDRERIRVLDSQCVVFRSKMLERLWPYGQSSIGNVTFESAAYVARYCLKKVTGKGAYQHYAAVDEFGEYEIVPEFSHMSLKPGIGAPWLEKFASDVFPHDYVVVNGKEQKPPRYYDKLFDVKDPAGLEEVKYLRFVEAQKYLSDNTVERLAVKETVAKARTNQFKREAF